MTGGVDTHADAHVAAALDGIGGLLGVQEFAATPAGYAHPYPDPFPRGGYEGCPRRGVSELKHGHVDALPGPAMRS